MSLTLTAAVEALLCSVLGDESAEVFPTIVDGVRGMRFIEQVVASSKAGGQWVSFVAPKEGG